MTREYKGKTYRSHLLRRSYREDGKVKKETLGNLTKLGDKVVGKLRLLLSGVELAPLSSLFHVISSVPHGHVAAVRLAMERLEVENLLASRPCRERELVLAMIAARILAPDTKLATTRWWRTTSLADVFNVSAADEDDLYGALDWLLDRQPFIEKKLAARHLANDGMVLYDLTSTCLEGEKCPLAARGHNRDGKKGKLQVNFGLVTDRRGCPVSVSVFKGNVNDSTTVIGQVEKVRIEFGVERMVLVGDRGMITQKQIDVLKDTPGCEWITALRTEAIASLVEGGAIQMELFDERNLFEIEQHPNYPGERLIACRNPELAKRRAHKRAELIEATKAALEKIRIRVQAGRLKGAAEIGQRIGKVIARHKVAKHFVLDIRDDAFEFSVDEDKVATEAALDGIYVVRTSLPVERSDADETVRSYKRLSAVERAFRSIKTVDLEVRPIHHHLEGRVRAHIFLCMLAYYVQWHMVEALRPLLFHDEDQASKANRDPVAPAQRSKAALEKTQRKRLADGTETHSFRTLLAFMTTIVRSQARRHDADDDEPSVEVDTEASPKQRRILELLSAITL